MNECIIVLNAINKNIDFKSEWANHRIFGSSKNKDINKRNATGSPELLDNNISIFNKDCHPFIDSELITLGAFIDNHNTQIKYSKLFYSLYGDSKVPESKICTEVYRTALKIKKKVKITQHQIVSKDKLYFFLKQNRKHTANIYNLMIKNNFLKDTHPSFENRWLTVFK